MGDNPIPKGTQELDGPESTKASTQWRVEKTGEESARLEMRGGTTWGAHIGVTDEKRRCTGGKKAETL